MTAIDAIPKISELLARLVKLAKDRETCALVQQIQEHQLVLHRELMEKDARIRELEQENTKLKEPSPAGQPRWGGQPRIKGRMER